MSEDQRIDDFNRELDRLLSGFSPDGARAALDPAVRVTLEPAALLAAVDFSAEIHPRGGLKERWQRQSARLRPRPALRWVWVGLAVALLALLVIFRQPVLASLGRLFGFAYLPQAGFVDLDQARLLQNAVTQVHEERSLTVTSGLITARDTQLWLEFSEEARAIDGAWLETPDGQRFELLNWGWWPDEPGSHGVAALFPSLPPEVAQVTLALPEGWRIPLTWVPGAESSLAPANVVALYPTDASVETPASSVAPSACADVLEISVCVQAAARSADAMQVLVETIPNGQYRLGSPFSLSPFENSGETEGIALIDEAGNSYPIDAGYIRMQGDEADLVSTFSFPGARELSGRLTLQIPALLASLPLEDDLVIDLGADPQPGEEWAIDQTVDVAGMPLHFGRVTLEGDGADSLYLRVYSDPPDPNAVVFPYAVEIGRPEGVQDRYGAGSGPDGVTIQVELQQPDGLVSGELHIPLTAATIKARTPFSLSFDAPAGLEATPGPQVITDGAFEPLPQGEPLPMDAFQSSGRALQAGDLLGVVQEGDHSLLYAASPEQDWNPEWVATLPGQVLAVQAHADGQGIDYLTGEYNTATANIAYRQLYTLRFGDPAPRLMVGQFERTAYGFAWSYDGRFLAYTASSDQPGASAQRYVRLIDLSCRESAACDAFTADSGDQDLYAITWSPSDYRMALGGTAQDQLTGASDIFLLALDAGTGATSLQNLTQSPQIDDRSPATWSADGAALFYACSTGATAVNEYSLCRSDLQPGNDEVVAPLLPWNMQFPRLAADRWLVDGAPVMNNGVYSLRSFDLQTGQTVTLLEWPASGKYAIEAKLSPDGRRAATYINDLGGLLVIDVETGENRLAVAADVGPLVWFGWVP